MLYSIVYQIGEFSCILLVSNLLKIIAIFIVKYHYFNYDELNKPDDQIEDSRHINIEVFWRCFWNESGILGW